MLINPPKYMRDLLAGNRYEPTKSEVKSRPKYMRRMDPDLIAFLEMIPKFSKAIYWQRLAAKYGKYSPEAERFTVRRLDRLIAELEALKRAVNNVE